jgi:DNA-binding MarR family transcriptional regulator
MKNSNFAATGLDDNIEELVFSEDAGELVSELYNRPGHLIRRAYQIAMALFIEEVQGVGVTQLQYVMLRAIRHHPDESHRRLSELTAIDRTTVGWIVTSLEEKGLLVVRANPNDRRRRRLELTPLGIRKLRAINARMPRHQARILEPLNVAERKQFMHCLRKVVLSNNRYSRAPLRPVPGNQMSGKARAGAGKKRSR